MSQIANLAPQGSAPAGDVVGLNIPTENIYEIWERNALKLLKKSMQYNEKYQTAPTQKAFWMEVEYT